MPLFRAYVVPALFGLCALALTGNGQTDRPRTEPATANEQTADTHPAAPGQDADSTSPASNDQPGTNQGNAQAGTVKGSPVPGQKIGRESPTQRATPAIPAAADQNSPLLTVPIQSQAEVLQNALFEFLFSNISDLNQIADSDDKAGKHSSAALWRTHDQRAAGLNDSEGEILREIALDCVRALKEQDAKIRTFGEKLRAQSTPGVIGPIPPELIQMVEDRKKIVSDHVEKLRESLGDASFNKLDIYVHSSFGSRSLSPKPAPARPPMTTTGNNNRKDQ